MNHFLDKDHAPLWQAVYKCPCGARFASGPDRQEATLSGHAAPFPALHKCSAEIKRYAPFLEWERKSL